LINFYSLSISIPRKLPKIEPSIKLEPTIKLIGSSIVSLIKKFTLFLFELFCIPINKSTNNVVNVPALSETFKPDEVIIKNCFSSFTEQPDFYAEPWKLRRSLDSSDIEIMDEWFFNMGGRGSLESRGSRQKNALLSAGLISILGELYGDQFQTLILASQPERLGEWRRILQDSLGLTRDDFGPNSGIVLFERPEGVIERADRLEANEELPFIIIDAAETSVEIPILQFPLWVAFAGSDNEIYDDLELN